MLGVLQVVVEDEVEDEDDEQTKAEHANTYFLEGMCFSEYGRGYMLYALKKHCLLVLSTSSMVIGIRKAKGLVL